MPAMSAMVENELPVTYAGAMKAGHISPWLVIAAAAAPLSAQSPEEEGPIAYRCDDVVVLGRFNNGHYQRVDIEGDILGHGWMTARIRVRRVLFGSVHERVVPVRYFGHTFYREDRDFVLVIRPMETDRHSIRSANLIDGGERPQLQRHCQ